MKADSGGTPDTASGPTTAVINNPAVLGVVGLPFSGESKAVGPSLAAAGLVNITPSATNPGLTKNGWQNFFRGLGNDAVQGPAAARFIQTKLNAQNVCVIRDDSEYGIGLADAVTQALGPQVAACQDQVRPPPCPTATSAAWRSPARWPPSPSCCASTNRRRVSRPPRRTRCPS